MEKLKTLLLLCLLGLAACRQQKAPEVVVPYYHTPDFTPIWTTDRQVIDTLHTIRPFRFTDQYGKPLTQADLKGKIYLTDFFFTSCTSICPRMTEAMKRVYEKFKGDPKIMFLSHSVTPQIDSAARLYRYAQSNGILSPQWRFVTGDKADIYDIARRSYFVEEYMGLSKDNSEFLHTEKFILVDAQGHLRGLYNGTAKTEYERIVSDIAALEGE